MEVFNLFAFSYFVFFTLVPLTLQSYSSSSQCQSDHTSGNTVPLALFSLPKSYPNAQQPQDAVALEQIRNTLGLYPLCIDGKNFDALDRVFTPNAVANFSTPIFVLSGLPAIQARLQETLALVDTQHSYGTQVVEIRHGGCEAVAVTYFIASHFGRGAHVGGVLYAYGQYQDTLVKISRTGEWRIKERNLVYMVCNIQPQTRPL